jgi:G8 domain
MEIPAELQVTTSSLCHRHRLLRWGARFTAVLAGISISLTLTAPSRAAASTPVGLSTCKTNPHRDVTIGGASGCGPDVQVDQDFTGASAFGSIKVDNGGTLSFPPITRALDLTDIIVNAGGTFQAGTTTNPIGRSDPNIRITLKFLGARPCKFPECAGFHKGIEVESRGAISLVGWKGVPVNSAAGANPNGISWTRLNAPAAKGSFTLTLADDVSSDWQPEDWITVATTSYSPFETEFVRILSVTKLPGGGSQVTLIQPLMHDHFGHLPPTGSQLCPIAGVITAVACGSITGCTSACT